VAVATSCGSIGFVGRSAGQYTPSAFDVNGRGASVPFVEQEAEDAHTTGRVIGPDRNPNSLAGEASGRRAVQLVRTGQYVEFTLTRAADAIDVRYSIPDRPNGQGYYAPIGLYLAGRKLTDLRFTNRYSWFYGTYPFTNDPRDGNPHHFYDDTRTLFGKTLPTGSKVRLQVTHMGASVYTIDLADFEEVGGPLLRPRNSVSVTSYGADPSGAKASSNAFDLAIRAGRLQGKIVWVPPGTYTVNRNLIVDQVTIRGAGPWYSELHGKGVGLYGHSAPYPSTAVTIADLAIFGEVQERNDADQEINGIGGSLGGGSLVSNVWIQHTKVGMWLDGPFDGLTITGCRIMDTTADGINLHEGISHVNVEDTFVRNTGDDGLAMWSGGQPDHDNMFRFNTIVAPMLANNIAIYGGYNNSASDNVVSDTQISGGGLHVGNEFNSVPLSGTTTLARNTILRGGAWYPNWRLSEGAIWFGYLGAQMDGDIEVTDTDIFDSSYGAIEFVGQTIRNVHFKNVDINGAGSFAVELQSRGQAYFDNVHAAGVDGPRPVYSCIGPGRFTFTMGSGNSGWAPAQTYCGPWPKPIYRGSRI